MQATKNTADTQLSQAFIFNASNQQVRTVTIENEPYFVVKDVCAILDISNHIDALSRLDEDEKGRSVIPTQFGAKETNLVNESGLYHLIFQSRKPEAKAFRKWVTAEVLPALRRTGRYEVKKQPRELTADFLDMRTAPFSTSRFEGYRVRAVIHNNQAWYSIGDLLRAMRVGTSASQSATRLAKTGRPVCKVFFSGGAHPAWCTSYEGVQQILHARRPQVQLK